MVSRQQTAGQSVQLGDLMALPKVSIFNSNLNVLLLVSCRVVCIWCPQSTFWLSNMAWLEVWMSGEWVVQLLWLCACVSGCPTYTDCLQGANGCGRLANTFIHVQRNRLFISTGFQSIFCVWIWLRHVDDVVGSKMCSRCGPGDWPRVTRPSPDARVWRQILSRASASPEGKATAIAA